MSNNHKYEDHEIIHLINKGGRGFEQIADYLFTEFQGFIFKIRQKLNLTEDQLHDAYADALVKLLRQVRSGAFRGESKLSSYFYRIFYNTAVDLSRKNATNKNIQSEELLEYNLKEQDLMKLIEVKDQSNYVLGQMKDIGDTCKRILIDWGYFGYSMDEIAKRSKLSSVESARSMKYKCLKKLKELLAKKKFD